MGHGNESLPHEGEASVGRPAGCKACNYRAGGGVIDSDRAVMGACEDEFVEGR